MVYMANINNAYRQQYMEIDGSHVTSQDKARLRHTLMEKHIRDLVEHGTVLEVKYDDLLKSHQKLEVEVEERDIQRRTDKSVVAEQKRQLRLLQDKLHEANTELQELDEALVAMTTRAREAEQRVIPANQKAVNMEGLNNQFRRQVEKTQKESDERNKEFVKLTRQLMECQEDKAALASTVGRLEQSLEEMEHQAAIYRTAVADAEAVLAYKEEEIHCHRRNLALAQDRILEWQVKALATDQCCDELSQLKERISTLLPELDELCTHNAELETYAACLKEKLDNAQGEIWCLRETSYKVALECAEIDTNKAILEKKLEHCENVLSKNQDIESGKQSLESVDEA